MAGLTLEHVYKKYSNEFIAVKDLNLEIKDQEFLVLVGPSGCGKSTALRMVAGLEEISSGNLVIAGKRVNDVPPKDRDIAMVFQSYALYPHMSVYDNMAFGLKLRHTPKDQIKKKVQEAADMLEIGHLLDRKPKQLSGGQRQRVALGRAIVREPKVFLMDEPLSNLDAKLRVATRTQISKLHQRLMTTIIYVTHDQTEAMTMADRIVVLKDGILQQEPDTPQNLYDFPDNMFVAGFIGSPPMNFFDAVLTGDSQTQFLDAGTFKIKVPEQFKRDLASSLNKEVVMGIRPEHISDQALSAQDSNEFNTANVKVEVVEPMGSEVYVYLASGKHNFIARLDSRTRSRPNDDMKVVFELNQIHVFDKVTQKSLVTRHNVERPNRG
ncbi:MAG: sn-glycerol-3-phosphate ABC transporter ATP-binding protein UgpC [Chloroflexi bacterium]|uniref:Sn-glycerol-3-phosphate ABC transporter ATP-binding protein UgpC n=1 Tax=Candidatus Chlorohelix allophototropha TaxID=3003348 RepID=A0A8T7LRA5_9CHLR|nr:sn-glycerol-3-phosphate ABC transporter ATP-binding protein UgpC [Chloroflexota bacterium]WJW66455.1 sn-glycerol-3-phosphate ABC transporter ATP-binding protein UgpC [Chloroflexota bacterium L227-S17]